VRHEAIQPKGRSSCFYWFTPFERSRYFSVQCLTWRVQLTEFFLFTARCDAIH